MLLTSLARVSHKAIKALAVTGLSVTEPCVRTLHPLMRLVCRIRLVDPRDAFRTLSYKNNKSSVAV